MPPLIPSLGPPYIRLLCGERAEFVRLSEALKAVPSAELRVVRGKRMSTKSALFEEVAAALQFPWYFGNNWDAFEECIRELEFVPSAHVVLGISDAQLLLCEEPEAEAGVFSQILSNAVQEFATEGQRSLHVVFQLPDVALAKKLESFLGPLEGV